VGRWVEVYLFNVVLLATTAILRLPLPGVDELIQILVMRFFDLLALTVAEAHVAFAAARLTAKRDVAASHDDCRKSKNPCACGRARVSAPFSRRALNGRAASHQGSFRISAPYLIMVSRFLI